MLDSSKLIRLNALLLCPSKAISAKAIRAGSISATTRCYEPKKRAHETLFGVGACSRAHCTLLLSAT